MDHLEKQSFSVLWLYKQKIWPMGWKQSLYKSWCGMWNHVHGPSLVPNLTFNMQTSNAPLFSFQKNYFQPWWLKDICFLFLPTCSTYDLRSHPGAPPTAHLSWSSGLTGHRKTRLNKELCFIRINCICPNHGEAGWDSHLLNASTWHFLLRLNSSVRFCMFALIMAKVSFLLLLLVIELWSYFPKWHPWTEIGLQNVSLEVRSVKKL